MENGETADISKESAKVFDLNKIHEGWMGEFISHAAPFVSAELLALTSGIQLLTTFMKLPEGIPAIINIKEGLQAGVAPNILELAKAIGPGVTLSSSILTALAAVLMFSWGSVQIYNSYKNKGY